MPSWLYHLPLIVIIVYIKWLFFCTYSSWARPWENVSYAICEQQRRRSACASAQSDQRLCCLRPRQNDTSSLYIRNFKILAGLCSWAGQFVSCLVGDSRRHIFSWRGAVIFGNKYILMWINVGMIDGICSFQCIWTTTRQNVSSWVSIQARHKPVCAATEAS